MCYAHLRQWGLHVSTTVVVRANARMLPIELNIRPYSPLVFAAFVPQSRSLIIALHSATPDTTVPPFRTAISQHCPNPRVARTRPQRLPARIQLRRAQDVKEPHTVAVPEPKQDANAAALSHVLTRHCRPARAPLVQPPSRTTPPFQHPCVHALHRPLPVHYLHTSARWRRGTGTSPASLDHLNLATYMHTYGQGLRDPPTCGKPPSPSPLQATFAHCPACQGREPFRTTWPRTAHVQPVHPAPYALTAATIFSQRHAGMHPKSFSAGRPPSPCIRKQRQQPVRPFSQISASPMHTPQHVTPTLPPTWPYHTPACLGPHHRPRLDPITPSPARSIQGLILLTRGLPRS